MLDHIVEDIKVLQVWHEQFHGNFLPALESRAHQLQSWAKSDGDEAQPPALGSIQNIVHHGTGTIVSDSAVLVLIFLLYERTGGKLHVVGLDACLPSELEL